MKPPIPAPMTEWKSTQVGVTEALIGTIPDGEGDHLNVFVFYLVDKFHRCSHFAQGRNVFDLQRYSSPFFLSYLIQRASVDS